VADDRARHAVDPTVGQVVTVWFDGDLVPPARPVLTALDHGLVVGDGVFEATKIVDGSPFALSRHLARLVRSAAALGLPPPDEEIVRSAVAAVTETSALPFGKLRITWTAGRGPLGSDREPDAEPTLVVAAAPAPLPQPEAAVLAVPWTRNPDDPLAGVKSTSYAGNVRALAAARAGGASEALFATTSGQLCEGTGSNVFVELDGELVTPPLSSGCLAGVTRDLVLAWTNAVEAEIPMTAVQHVSEAFLTSSMRDLQPVRRWDARDLGPAGPLTLAAMAAWREHTSGQLDP